MNPFQDLMNSKQITIPSIPHKSLPQVKR